MAYNRFRRGQGCFTCRICGKRTRDVNGSNGCIELCPRCEIITGAENTHSDNDHVGDFKDCPICKEDMRVQGVQ